HRIQSGADHPDPPRATQPPDSRSANMGDPNSDGGRRGPRYQARELLVNIHPALKCSILGPRLKPNLAIASAAPPDQPKATPPPISTPRMGQPATPFRGAPGNRCKRA